MTNKLPSVELVIEVPFYDLDPMNVVWHGNYIKYFELVRCQLLDEIDYGYLKMKDSGYMWPIVDIQLKYINSASFGQILICTATLVEYENRIKIKYTINCKNTGQRLTKGYSIQVAVDMNTKELQLVSPSILHKKLKKFI